MAMQLPSTGKPGCDTSDMNMIHGMFRRALEEGPGLVRAVPADDGERLAAVSSHVDDLIARLHGHHRGEDLLLWDQLAARAPACAKHVADMRTEHAAVAALLDALEPLVQTWRGSGKPEDGDKVATALEAVRTTLFAHLGEEEAVILPVASGAFTQQEWDKIGAHARAEIPRDRMLIQLGYILSSMTPTAARAWAKKELPAPVRLLYRLVGKRQFEAQRKSIGAEMVRTSA